MTDQTLAELIREAADECPEADLRKIAALVVERTPKRRLADFYAEALGPMVRIVFGQQRNNAATAVRRGVSTSARMARSRDWWQDYLESWLSVGNLRYKRMRDATVDDLAAAINSRQAHVASVQEQIDHYHRIIAAMETQGAQTVGDLSGSVQ